MKSPRHWLVCVFVIYGLALLAGVLSPQPIPPDIGDRPFLAAGWLADAIRNVVLFAPLGWVLRLVGVGGTGIALVAVALSGSIELAQGWIPGRFTSALDIVSNAAGAWVGGWVPAISARLRREADVHAGRLAASCALASATVLVLCAILAAPSLPSSRYYGGWTPRYAGLEVYRGEVWSADVGGQPIPPFGPVTETEALREALERGAPISMTFRVGPPTAGLAPVLSIVDDRQQEIALIGIDGDTLVYHLRSRAAPAGLHSPMARVPGAFALEDAGAIRSLRVDRTGAGSIVRLDGQAAVPVDLPISRGWAFLVWPGSVPSALTPLLDALWLAGLLCPVAWLAVRRPIAWTAVAGLAVLLLTLPEISGLAGLTVVQWGWSAVAVAAAALASRAAQGTPHSPDPTT